MTYLTGKRFEYPDGNSAGVKTGVIVSEPFTHQGRHGFVSTVAIMWDDGSMEGVIDVELLKVLPKREPDGYVVAMTWPNDEDGELIAETYTANSTLDEAKRRADRFFNKNPRIAEFYFMEE